MSRPTPDDGSYPFGMRTALLDGVKVLDLTRFLAGPFTTMILGDLGARVLKVEQPPGDSSRLSQPYFHEGDSAYYLAINRNKESLAIDLRTPAGQEVLRKLVQTHDVVIDNLRPEQRTALGLDFAQLSAVNPSIVSCSLTGFGSNGPEMDRPAYDIIVEALSGVMSLTGPEGGPSVRAGVPIGDLVAGLYAAIGILAGLQSKDRTGVGTHVDVGMLDCQLSLLSYLAQYYFTGGLVATHQGRAHVSIPTYNTFATNDGTEIVIAANTARMWESLCDVLDHPEWTSDARFRQAADRLTNRIDLEGLLAKEIAAWAPADLERALRAAGVPAAPIKSIEEALADPQVRARDMVVRVPHRSGADFLSLGSPIKDDVHGASAPFSSPPGYGEHSIAVLTELGFDADQIRSMQEEGIVPRTT